jgi:type IV pilus assembly protein PilO
MADIKAARRRFTAIAIVLVCLDLAAAGILMSPIGKGARAGQRKLSQLWAELRLKERDVLPLKDIDKKVIEAKEEISRFYDARLPGSYSSISEELGKLAAENRVTISAGKYDTQPAEIAGLSQVRVNAQIAGDYLQAVKFINALERDKLFFIINGVSVTESTGGAVRLEVRLETYLRSV